MCWASMNVRSLGMRDGLLLLLLLLLQPPPPPEVLPSAAVDEDVQQVKHCCRAEHCWALSPPSHSSSLQ